MRQKIIKYGLIAGTVIVGIPMVTSFVIGTGPESYKTSEVVGYSTMILSLLIIFVAINEHKKQFPETNLSFGGVLLIGCGISSVAGAMFGFYNWLYVEYIDPGFMDQYFDYYIENIRNSGAPQAQIETQIARLHEEKAMFMNPVVNFTVMFATVFVIGSMISVVAGFFQTGKNKAQTKTS